MNERGMRQKKVGGEREEKRWGFCGFHYAVNAMAPHSKCVGELSPQWVWHDWGIGQPSKPSHDGVCVVML